jgi:hypothetical protein
VGLITSTNGSFDFLFNICLPANHAINGNNVPANFTPLDIEIELEQDPVAYEPGHYIANGDVETLSHPL